MTVGTVKTYAIFQPLTHRRFRYHTRPVAQDPPSYLDQIAMR